MDANSQQTSSNASLPTAHSTADGDLVVDNSVHPSACTLCRTILSPDNDDLETIGICGDCKFLLLEDLGGHTPNSPWRRNRRGRRTRDSSSESIENLFSQQFSQMINLVRQNQLFVSGHEDQSIDSDASVRLLQRTSTRTTPSSSRRWLQVLSDTESEGFDNLDSLYSESETNLSFSRYRIFHGESDALSVSVYGGDSDASVDGHSFLDTEMFIQPDDAGNLDSDTDIDPMHAGLSQWNSDDGEEEEYDNENGEWEEADIERDTVESLEAGAQLQNIFISSPNGANHNVDLRPRIRYPQFEDLIYWRNRQGGQTHVHNVFTNSEEETELAQYVQNAGDYLDARGFEELLEHLAETDSSRRGAPPASVSFVNRLPRIVINKEHEKHDGLACAICKDVLLIGTEVNQLPCLHLYHPYCILPWLNARNSCPLCRYELPTDDKDYEDGKRNRSGRMGIHEFQQQDVGEDSSSDGEGDDGTHEFDGGGEQRHRSDANPAIGSSSEGREGSGRWFFLAAAAAAPIVSLMGIVLVLWLGNAQGRGLTRYSNFLGRGQPLSHQMDLPSSSSAPNQRGSSSTSRRRWWSFF